MLGFRDDHIDVAHAYYTQSHKNQPHHKTLLLYRYTRGRMTRCVGEWEIVQRRRREKGLWWLWTWHRSSATDCRLETSQRHCVGRGGRGVTLISRREMEKNERGNNRFIEFTCFPVSCCSRCRCCRLPPRNEEWTAGSASAPPAERQWESGSVWRKG